MANWKARRTKRKESNEIKVHPKRVYLRNDATCEGRKTNPFSLVYSASCPSQFTFISYSTRRVSAVGMHSITIRRDVRTARSKTMGPEMDTGYRRGFSTWLRDAERHVRPGNVGS